MFQEISRYKIASESDHIKRLWFDKVFFFVNDDVGNPHSNVNFQNNFQKISIQLDRSDIQIREDWISIEGKNVPLVSNLAHKWAHRGDLWFITLGLGSPVLPSHQVMLPSFIVWNQKKL